MLANGQCLQQREGIAYVEPGKAAPRLPERSLVLTTRALLEEEDTPEPIDGCHCPEVDFLFVQSGRDIMAHQREKAGNGESLVAIA